MKHACFGRSFFHLQMLNATEISYADRGGAEYDYLKKYGLEWLAVKDTEKREEFLEDHNRYLELIKGKWLF